jgi:hypothetical protein
MFTPHPGELYLRYETDLTLEKYAACNRIDLEPLLKLLNAAAEDRQPPASENPYRKGPVIGTIGYTGSYRAPDPNVEYASVVEVQSIRGPE